MFKLPQTAVILLGLIVVFQAADARPHQRGASSPVSKAEIEDWLDSIQQRLAYLVDDTKNLIDNDIDPLIDEIDDFIACLQQLFHKSCTGKN